MTEEEFRLALRTTRAIITAFLSIMPQSATVAEVLAAVNAERAGDPELERSYRAFIDATAETNQTIN